MNIVPSMNCRPALAQPWAILATAAVEPSASFLRQACSVMLTAACGGGGAVDGCASSAQTLEGGTQEALRQCASGHW